MTRPAPIPTHRCPALKCQARVVAKYLMCPRHWFKVPQKLRIEVWSTYHDGMRKQTHPTVEYVAAVDAAIVAVGLAESGTEGGAR